jgi:hypothetical protein
MHVTMKRKGDEGVCEILHGPLQRIDELRYSADLPLRPQEHIRWC